jgi:hypothetical protein
LHELIELNPHPAVDTTGNESAGALIPFWITPHQPRGPIGIGVTAHSLSDARAIAERFGYVIPPDADVIAHVRHENLDPFHIAPNAGPIVVRGLWYPFVKLGV